MKKIIFLSVSVLFLSKAFSQDETFVNTGMSLLESNPSFAGSNGGIRNQFLYRKKWPKLSGNNSTTYNGLDAYVKELGGGIAVTYMDESLLSGTLRTKIANLIYAPTFKCNQTGLTIVPSLQAGFIQMHSVYSSFGSGTLQTVPTSDEKKLDLGAGLLVNYEKLYVGFSAFHINQPDLATIGVNKLATKYSLNASYNVFMGSNVQMNLAWSYTYQRYFTSMQAGVNALFSKHYIVGAGLGSANVFYAKLGYRHDLFALQICYDRTFSRLSEYYSDSYELCASFNLRNKANRHLLTNFESW